MMTIMMMMTIISDEVRDALRVIYSYAPPKLKLFLLLNEPGTI